MDHPNKYRIAYLPQKPVFEENVTVLQAVFSGNSPILQLNREYEEVVKELSLHPESETLQNKLFQLQQRMDAEKAWDVNALAKQALTKLGIDMFDEQVSNLSGGQQKRVALAKVLIEPADLYLLDEPTNHLDAESTEWLQEMILRLKGAIIFITHDRYFLMKSRRTFMSLRIKPFIAIPAITPTFWKPVRFGKKTDRRRRKNSATVTAMN